MTNSWTLERIARYAAEPLMLLTAAIILQVLFLTYTILHIDTVEPLLSACQNMVIAQPLFVTAVLIQTLRFRLLFPHASPSLSVAAKSTFIGIGLNFVLPARLSELPRVAYLSSNTNLPMHDSMSAIMLEKLADILALALTVAALALLQPHLPIPPVGLLFAAGFLLGALILGRYAIIAFLRSFGLQRFADFAEAIISNLAYGLRQPSFVPAVFLSLASFALVIIASQIVLGGILPEPLPWHSVTLLFVVSILGTNTSPLPGGAGGFHGAVVITLLTMDIDTGAASIAALALHGQQFLITLPVALTCLRRQHIDVIAWFRQAISQEEAAPSNKTFDRSSTTQ